MKEIEITKKILGTSYLQWTYNLSENFSHVYHVILIGNDDITLLK